MTNDTNAISRPCGLDPLYEWLVLDYRVIKTGRNQFMDFKKVLCAPGKLTMDMSHWCHTLAFSHLHFVRLFLFRVLFFKAFTEDFFVLDAEQFSRLLLLGEVSVSKSFPVSIKNVHEGHTAKLLKNKKRPKVFSRRTQPLTKKCKVGKMLSPLMGPKSWFFLILLNF